jgi:2',3'-cyclic-nucleotide 2'-phosphodiesterase (5'-nucleotidase family)
MSICRPLGVSGQQPAKFTMQRATILLDSTTYDNASKTAVMQKIAHYHSLLSEEMEVVIGRSSEIQVSFEPASPLSNLLTDLLFDYGNRYMKIYHGLQADLSLLNFGGIRNVLPEGDITVGDIYKIAPFENYAVIIGLKGSELKKALNRFTDKKNQPFSQLKVVYLDGIPREITINGNLIEDDKVYYLVTLDFIQNGGDGILKGIKYTDIVETGELFRDVLIEEIKQMAAEGQTITPRRDDRVMITPHIKKPQ